MSVRHVFLAAMDPTTLIVIFLAFTSVTVVTNTLLFWFAYKGFSGFTLKVTETVREVEKSGATREWIQSLERAAARAVSVTETTKQKIAEYDPELERIQVGYSYFLAKIDTRTERLASDIREGAATFQDAVTGPLEKFSLVASGLKSVLGFVAPKNGNNGSI